MNIAVIGGGASGMAAALAGAKEGAHVTVYEHNPELGKKILTTGNGRCNLGNMNINKESYHNGISDELLSCLIPEDVIAFFEDLGLCVKEKDGWLYPVTDQAKTVRDVLVKNLEKEGVKTVLNSDIEAVIKEDNGCFTVINKGKKASYDSVILACGSYAGILKKDRIESSKDGYSLAYSLGHNPTKVKSALTGIICEDKDMKDILSGLRIKGRVGLYVGDELLEGSEGEIQFTDYGISGISVFDVSRTINREDVTKIRIVFEEDGKESRIKKYYGRTLEEFFLGFLNDKLSSYYMKVYGLNKTDIIDDKLSDRLKELSLNEIILYPPFKTRSFEHAQVCTGGILTDDVDENFMSKKTKDLYIVGEMLDVDGRCGGYNLTFAWISGIIAGKSAALYNH